MKHILSVLVNNQPRVLARVSSLLGQRNFNIESISVGESEEPGLSRMVIITSGDERTLAQATKQLSKLVDVIKVEVLDNESAVVRELVLVKIKVEPSEIVAINGIVDPFRATVVDVSHDSVIVQATGERSKLDALVELLQPYGVVEVVRTGVIAQARGQVKASVSV